MDFSMAFTDRLKKIIGHSGLKREDFAVKCGISRAQLFNYLKGDQEPGTGFYRKLKTNMPIYSLEWLIAGIGGMTSDDSVGHIQEDKSNAANDTPINYEDVLHSDLVKEFRQKKLAKECNIKMIELEKIDPDELKEVDDFLDYRLSKNQKKGASHTTLKGTDRRKNRAG